MNKVGAQIEHFKYVFYEVRASVCVCLKLYLLLKSFSLMSQAIEWNGLYIFFPCYLLTLFSATSTLCLSLTDSHANYTTNKIN